MWGNKLQVNSYGGELATWLSEFLEIDGLDLTKLGDKELITRNRKEFDFAPFMLLSEATLAELNSRLETKVDIRRFRPNLVAKNVAEAFNEV